MKHGASLRYTTSLRRVQARARRALMARTVAPSIPVLLFPFPDFACLIPITSHPYPSYLSRWITKSWAVVSSISSRRKQQKEATPSGGGEGCNRPGIIVGAPASQAGSITRRVSWTGRSGWGGGGVPVRSVVHHATQRMQHKKKCDKTKTRKHENTKNTRTHEHATTLPSFKAGRRPTMSPPTYGLPSPPDDPAASSSSRPPPPEGGGLGAVATTACRDRPG